MHKPGRSVLLGAVFAAAALYPAHTAIATPASGFAGSSLAQGKVGEFDVFNHYLPPGPNGRVLGTDVWLSSQKTKGTSDVYVQGNTWQPGGSTGWHSHPGHSLIIVTAGTVTVYDGNDPDCTPHVYTAMMSFVDPGGDHVHVIRNEADVVAKTVAVQLIPEGTPRRIDAPDPGTCPF